MRKIALSGLDYIGLPAATVATDHGYEVVGAGVNPSVVETINQGKTHVVELELGQVVKKVMRTGSLRAVSESERADALLVVAPTPFKRNHRTDITYVESTARSVIPYLQEGDLFAVESTSPASTTGHMAKAIYKERPGLRDKIHIAYCPERVLPGNTLYELVHNDRVIGGINPESAAEAIGFYPVFVQGKLHPTNARTAEMCKLTENSSYDSQTASIDELSMTCGGASTDVWELVDLANKYPRVNILQPGCGVDGRCITVDPWSTISDYPERAQTIKRACETNSYKVDWYASKVVEVCQQFVEKSDRELVVAYMGLAFKPDIDDLYKLPAKYVASHIISESHAEVLIIEPNVVPRASFHLTNYRGVYKKADIVIWFVRHIPLVELPREKGRLELDFCGVRK